MAFDDPAYYLMATSAIAAVTIYFLPESARRHLPRSMPSVDLDKAAQELVATQDDNAMLDMDTLPFGTSYGAAKASH